MSKTNFSEHLFQYRLIEKRKLVLSLLITSTVMILEIFGGIITNSIALLSDAGHMFTHSFAIGISLLAIIIARKPPCHHKTFGLYRAEVLAAFINGLFLIPIVGIMVYEAILRFINPQEVFGFYMLIIALIGLSVNITSVLILRGSQRNNLNVKSVFYHMIADAASSIGIVIASIIISYTGFNFLDPLVSLGISVIILYWAWSVLRESTRILLEMAPKGMNIDIIREELKENFQEVIDLYNAHLWTITPDMLVFSAYLKVDDNILNSNQGDLVSKIKNYLNEKYNIIESTLQLISVNNPEYCNI
ncbi:MAG: cation diffusion facilitator family transporter [Candidatus Heimdallarchaeota archaeon]